jgi:MraZ protein
MGHRVEPAESPETTPMLLGEYTQRLDEKNRVTIPARLREAFTDGVFVTRGLDHCVALYARDGWEDFVAAQTARLDPFTREGRQMERFLFGGAVEAELDRQGRVAIPAPLLSHAALEREIVVAGVRDRLEIWDRGAWERALVDLEGSAEVVAERLVRDAR